MINVIWVDDLILNPDGSQTDLCKSIVNSAYDEGIDITPFATYDEAYNTIVANPSKWIAIILDIRNDKASEGDENQGFLFMRDKIREFRTEHGKIVEPFIFIFSADADAISNPKRSYTKDSPSLQTKEVYVKPDDKKVLFEDIKKAANSSQEYEIRTKYKNIIDFIERVGWSRENINSVLKLIRCIDYNDENTNYSLYNDMRKIVESDLYKRIEEVGLMNDYWEYLKNEGKDDSLNVKSIFVGKKKDFPIYIQRAFHSLTEILNNGSHRNEKQLRLVVDKDTLEGKAPYLLKSCLYDLLTIINWEATQLENYSLC